MADTPTLTGLEEAGVLRPESLTSESIEAATEVVESLETKAKLDSITLSNGIVLKLKAVPPLAMREAAISVPQPKVPVVFVESLGRAEENPNDPDYARALTRWENDQVFRVADVLMLLGTSVESVPEGYQRPEDEEWFEELEVLGLAVDGSNRHKRRLAWLRMYAFTSERDIAATMAAITALSGTTEVEVGRAAAAFRNNTGR
jgi:hypothetical protein